MRDARQVAVNDLHVRSFYGIGKNIIPGQGEGDSTIILNRVNN
jgi:hypothetical protein